MKVKCIDIGFDKYYGGSSNFTIGKVYETIDNPNRSRVFDDEYIIKNDKEYNELIPKKNFIPFKDYRTERLKTILNEN